MFSSLFGKKHVEPVMVFDFGSGSVAAGILHTRHGYVSEYVITNRMSISHENRVKNQIITILSEKMIEVGEKTIREYLKSGGDASNIRRVFVIVHSPWVNIITQRFEAQLRETMSVVPDMIDQLRNRNRNIKKEQHGVIFEDEIVRIDLNGYKTNNPYGKDAEHLSVTTMVGRMEDNVFKAINDVVVQLLPDRKLIINSSVFAYMTTLQSGKFIGPSYTIVDVTSESTMISSVYRGEVVANEVVGVGSRDLIRSLSENMKSGNESIASYLRMQRDGECSDNVCRSMIKKSDEFTNISLKEFGEAFNKISEHGRVPNTIILSSSKETLIWFKNFLSRIDFGQFTLTTKPFSVHNINNQMIEDAYVIFHAKDNRDTGLMLSGAFVHIVKK